MKHKTKIFTVLIVMLLAATITISCAQKNVQSSYNYTRAYELLESGDVANALDYLNKQISENPKDYNSLLLRGVIYYYDDYGYENYSQALKDLNAAIKYTPSKDKETLIGIYQCRAELYSNIDMNDKAEADLLQALKYSPKNEDILLAVVRFYLGMKNYNKTEEYSNKLLKVNDISAVATLALGIVAQLRDKNYDKAITYYDKAITFSPSYTGAYNCKASLLCELGRYKKALDAAISAIEINIEENTAWQYVSFIIYKSPNDVIKKMSQFIREQSTPAWQYYSYRGDAYSQLNDYDNAIADYLKVEEIFEYNNAGHYVELAQAYQNKGDYANALMYANKAIEIAKDKGVLENNPNLYITRADIYSGLGKLKNAIKDCDSAIEVSSQYEVSYYYRGYVYRTLQQYGKALADFNEALELDSTYIIAYLYRGRVYAATGKSNLAKKDWETVLRLDTAIKPSNHKCFALHHLGRDKEAIDFINKILAEYPEKAAYNAGCLYSLMNDKKNALKYLESALKTGNIQDFNHIDRDDDWDNIRNTAEFKALIAKYDNRGRFGDRGDAGVTNAGVGNADVINASNYEERTTTIKMKKTGGVFEVPTEINGLKIKLIFDSGASDVTISLTEANFMLKNDYIKPKDILGKQQYMTASGDIAEGTVINLKEVKLGDFTLKDVRASVVHNQNAPLLLGQTVLKRFATIEINNEKQELVIKYRK